MRSQTERMKSDSYDQILNRCTGRGDRFDVALLGGRIRERTVGKPLSIRHVCDQHHGLVPRRFYHDRFGRADAFKSDLEIPVGGWISGRV